MKKKSFHIVEWESLFMPDILAYQSILQDDFKNYVQPALLADGT
jgi:hypothetical protein